MGSICRDEHNKNHIRSLACEALSRFPLFIPLYPGIHGEVVMSKSPKWLVNSSPGSKHDIFRTRVLVPVRDGLVELFSFTMFRAEASASMVNALVSISLALLAGYVNRVIISGSDKDDGELRVHVRSSERLVDDFTELARENTEKGPQLKTCGTVLSVNLTTRRSFASPVVGNPKKSKHLETGKMRLCNQWLDFVQLRKEEADENSCVPKAVASGTPEEDAFRRDLTINSLFYNILDLIL
ncbi:hypothetical protein F2Q68_00042561 [Brassica cretica]|uniref:Poly A polymerase head domain-containing protein n=1 Tax=Brassica cretica TaxID=69181 RepID=A0A8S9MH11_BRACR|nr:hypothetical protein F2Q68_00042561 [Brassica cretica]